MMPHFEYIAAQKISVRINDVFGLLLRVTRQQKGIIPVTKTKDNGTVVDLMSVVRTNFFKPCNGRQNVSAGARAEIQLLPALHSAQRNPRLSGLS